MDFAHLLERYPSASIGTAGGTVSWREAPGARPVVLLHGIGSASGSWLRQLQALGGGHRVLAWDAPGYGGSTPLAPERPGPADYAVRLWQWLDALGVDGPVTLVGHSLGALMAGAAVLAQPARVRNLLLLSPAGGYGQADPELRESKRRDRLANLRTLGPAGMAEKRAAAMLSPAAPPALVAYVRSIMAQVHPAGYTQATHMLAEGDLGGLLAQVRSPVRVASGEADTITPPASCRAIAAQAGAPYLSLGPVGHACALEAADTVSRLIEESVA